ncbi:hypothetical protein T492DRAFT_65817 [Pavlovales sp. CCMP2436]|nr:hypothetical protein T492DRAFT_65817 [Pavlovales sp. CCMP2436]
MAAGSAGSAEAGSEAADAAAPAVEAGSAAADAAAGAAGAVGAGYSPAMLAMKAKQPWAMAAGSEAGSAEAGSTAVASTAPLCLSPRATASPSAVSPSYGRTGGATRGSYNAGRGRRANDQQCTEAVRSALKSGATGGETAVATGSTLPPSSDHARPGVDLICLRFALRASLAQESAST